MADVSDFEEVVQSIHLELADDSIGMGIFLPSLAEVSLTSRFILWVPTVFTSQLPLRANTNASDVQLTDHLTVEAYFCAETFFDAQEIRRKVLSASRRLYGAGIVPSNGAYVSQIHHKPNAVELQDWAGGVIMQRFVWLMDVTRADAAPYRAHIKEIDIVDGTQITTTVDGVLTPDEQMEITEQD